MKRVLVPIANGSEEIEAVCIIDTLRRAGADVTVASVENDKTVVCSRKTVIVADTLITNCADQEWDLIALPGGMPGAENLKNNEILKQLLIKQSQRQDKYFAAVCASPGVVLAAHGLLNNHQATAYPSHQAKLPNAVADKRVVISGNCITSQGPGTSLEFAITLVEVLYGREKAQQLAESMLVKMY